MAKHIKTDGDGGLDAMEYSILAAQRVGSTVTGAFWQITPESFEKSKKWHELTDLWDLTNLWFTDETGMLMQIIEN
jgi:hypothetical protein